MRQAALATLAGGLLESGAFCALLDRAPVKVATRMRTTLKSHTVETSHRMTPGRSCQTVMRPCQYSCRARGEAAGRFHNP